MMEDTSQRSSHALSRFVLDHMPEPVLVLDSAGNIIEANRAARDRDRYSGIAEPFEQKEPPPSVVSFLARLRATKTDQNLLLLKTNMGAGHGGKSGRWDSLKEVAETYAFILTQVAE